MLRSRLHGDAATWDAIVAKCLEGNSVSLDQGLIEMLFGVLQDPESIVNVMRALESRLPAGHDNLCPGRHRSWLGCFRPSRSSWR